MVAPRNETFGTVLAAGNSWAMDSDSTLRRWHLPMEEEDCFIEVEGYEYSDRVEITKIHMIS